MLAFVRAAIWTNLPVLLCCLLGGSFLAHAQTPAWQTAIAFDQAAGSDLYPSQLVPDGSGNLLLAGSFAGTVHFGSTTLTSLGARDIFVAKWNPATGIFAWALQAGGASGDEFVGALTSSGTSIYVAGNFSSATVNFGPTALPNRSYENLFVAKLTDAGSSASFTWALRGGAGLPRGTGLAVSGSSLYLTGSFAGTGDFGALTLNSTNNSDDAFLSKITDAGATASFTWTQRLGGTVDDYASALVLSGTSLFITGELSSSTATVGAATLPSTSGTGHMFVSKFTDTGLNMTHNWTQRGGATLEDSPGTVLAIVGSTVYVGGNFGSTATFGAVTFQRQGSNGTDVFVTKLTDAGTSASFVWAQQAGGTTGYDFARSLLVRGSTLYLAGDFYGVTGKFGALSLANTDATGVTRDVYVTKLIDAGSTSSFTWALGAGYPDDNIGGPLVLVGSQLYLTGLMRGSVMDFSSLRLRNPVAAGGHYGGYIASLSDAVGLATTSAISAPAVDVFPNPAHTSTQVRLPAALQGHEVQLTLLDATGRVVRTQALAASARQVTHELSLAGVVPGLYMLRFEAAAGSSLRRLVVN
jgi:hypothetical protein